MPIPNTTCSQTTSSSETEHLQPCFAYTIRKSESTLLTCSHCVPYMLLSIHIPYYTILCIYNIYNIYKYLQYIQSVQCIYCVETNQHVDQPMPGAGRATAESGEEAAETGGERLFNVFFPTCLLGGFKLKKLRMA